MDEKMTMEITNDRLEEAIKQYAAERTKENLTTVLNLLRPTKLYVPAMLKAPDQPTPCFLKNNKGAVFCGIYFQGADAGGAEEPGTSFHAVPGVQQHRREAGTGADRAGHQSVLG